MTNVTTTGAIAQIFTFSAHALRVIMRDGNPWFVASDVCTAIGITNYRNAVEKLDDDEKGVHSVDTIGGAQEMLIVNESGLNAIILRSRDAMTPGAPSHKYRKWVTSEVLPAIRKTGRFEAKNATQATTTPAHVNERLTGADLQNIKRMIWMASRGFIYESSWNQAIWFYLRMALNLPSPHPFGVDQLPQLAQELQRINSITCQVHDVIREIEAQAAKRLFRKAENADMVIADLRRLAVERMATVADDASKFPQWLQGDVAAITSRTAPGWNGHLAYDEKPEYFSNTQGATA